MTDRVETVAPEPSALLCENCGYNLHGLELSGRCPECGQPIVESSASLRSTARFEQSPGASSFVRTTLAVLLRPTAFYRTFAPRSDNRWAVRFCAIHLVLAGLFVAGAALLHYGLVDGGEAPLLTLIPALLLTALLPWLVVRLTAYEAGVRGLRLPADVVARALYFQAPNVALASVVLLAYVGAFAVWRAVDVDGAVAMLTQYIYGIGVIIVLTGFYLFRAYWIAMRQLMYANG